MGALTHNGEVLQSLPANASQINFDKTGTDLNSTQTENAIKEVNTKVNTNADDITQLKSGLIGVNYTLNDSVKGETITRLRGNVTKISNVVTITGAWSGSATNEDIITTIPEGYRPSGNNPVIGSGTADNSGTLAYAEYTVMPDGRLRQAQFVGAVIGGTFAISYAI